ncbi:MAG: D-2-hydroxyacid dehydrogenase [Rhodospirillales bacterium]|nr:D-2-hydroxyacid dehydrogenase [Rhodospirillales bacterium]
MIEVLAIQRLSEADRAAIAAVGPEVRLTDAGGWFDGEIRDSWPEFTVRRYLPADEAGKGTRAERDALLAGAEVILGGWPFPLDLRARARRLKWFHQRPAGASNLRRGDLWDSDVIVTTSRGQGNTLAMAEYAIAGILHFAKAFDAAVAERASGGFDHRAYRPLLLAGKTLLVVGTGGIGAAVGKLGAGLGMRVLGTRWRSAAPPPEGFAATGGPEALDAWLGEADFLVLCCPWTEATTHLMNASRFARLRAGAVVVNVARGEIIEEPALAAALASGRLRGVVLDVYQGEFEHEPPGWMREDPRVIVTPHVSSASDRSAHGAVALFCANLRAYLDGKPMRNVVDWSVGY